MKRTIDTTVNAGTTVHIGVTVMPLKFDTVRFTPLTDTGRRILRMGCNEYRISMGLNRGHDLYNQLNCAGYQFWGETVDHPGSAGKWDCADYAEFAYFASNRPDYSLQSE